MRVPARLLAVAVLASGLVSGCAGIGVTPPPPETRVDVDTPALRRAKAEAGIATCPTDPPGGGSDLPGVSLPCLGGGEPVRLEEVGGPAVLPLWASWCEPCKKELPLYARLARRSEGQLTVLGVDYQDTQPDLAIELLQASGARFPQVADPGGTLADTYQVRGLPGMLWVEEDGTTTFRNELVHSYDELTRLVSSELGISLRGAG